MSRKTKKKKPNISQHKTKHISKKDISVSPYKAKIITFLPMIISLCIIAIALVIRLFAFQLPIMGDEAVYSILGKKAFMGERIYADFYEFKPPLLYYISGLGTTIFGWSGTGLRAFGLAIVLCNSTMVYILSKKYCDIALSLCIAGVSLFLMNNIYCFGPETLAEHFVLTFVLGGFLFLEYLPIKKLGINYLLAGLLICGAAMIKQSAALFGLVSILYLFVHNFKASSETGKKGLLKSIILLAIGAFIMIFLNIIPIWLSNSFSEAKYWLFDIATQYVTSINFSSSLLYLETYGGRIFQYQSVTLAILLLSFASMFFSYKKKYFIISALLLAASIINIFPGYRYYGQYWIPLLTLAPLSIIGLEKSLNRVINNTVLGYALPLLFLFSITADTVIHRAEYFEKGYRINAEKAHFGNSRNVYLELTNDINKRIQPGESFIMLGPQVFTYFDVNRFPDLKHIYPRNIARNTPQNKIFQKEAYAAYSEIEYDYLILSVTGVSWSSPDNFDDWLYQRTFGNTLRNYDPIWVFNIDESRFYNAEGGEEVDLYKPNQIISFKKK